MKNQTPTYANWQNNAHPQWWKDAGLRRMAWHIFILYCCVFTFGYDGSLFAGLQALKPWQTYFGHPVSSTLGLMVAAFYLPKIVAPSIASLIGDRWGRRPVLLGGAIISFTGAMVNAFSTSTGMFIGGRVMMGTGLGMHATIAPTLVQEIVHPRMRSVVGGMWLLMYPVGGVLASWLAFGFVNWDSNWSWRVILILQGVGNLIVGIYTGLGFMCESPRWLLNKGRGDEALRLLAQLHANGDENDELVQHEMAEMLEIQRRMDAASTVGYKTFFATKGNRKRLFVLIMISLGSQMTGGGVIGTYLTTILKQVGITSSAGQTAINGGSTIETLFVFIIGAQFVERVGRRPIWLFNLVGMVISYSMVTALSGSYAQHPNAAVGTAVIPFLYIWTIFYNACFGLLANLYVAEILPFSLRSKGMSIYVTVQNVAIAFNSYVNPIALAAIHWKYYIVWIIIQVWFVIFGWVWLIETKGYTIEEVAELFDGKEQAQAVMLPADTKMVETPGWSDKHDVELVERT